MWIIKYVRVGVILSAISCGAVAQEAEKPEWHVHARWCTTDRGSSNSNYIRTCKDHDQYDAILVCQSEGSQGNARAKITEAGRTAVNAYMYDRMPSECFRGFSHSGG